MKLASRDLWRYALWLGVLYTANANRKYFGLPTTWVIHTTLNTIVLFLPEITRGGAALLALEARAAEKQDVITTLYGAVKEAVVENPNYAWEVAPLPLAYIVSHPQFNIYKGEWAKLRLFGFGLDAIPHSATAFGFSNLAMDGLAALNHHTPPDASWRALAQHADTYSAAVAGTLLVGASALYEAGEYAVHEEELRETGGDERKINMEWGVTDTVFDLMSNTLGWLAAALLRPLLHPARRAPRRSSPYQGAKPARRANLMR